MEYTVAAVDRVARRSTIGDVAKAHGDAITELADGAATKRHDLVTGSDELGREMRPEKARGPSDEVAAHLMSNASWNVANSDTSFDFTRPLITSTGVGR